VIIYSPAITTRSNRDFQLSPRIRLSKFVMRNPPRRLHPLQRNRNCKSVCSALYAQTESAARPQDGELTFGAIVDRGCFRLHSDVFPTTSPLKNHGVTRSCRTQTVCRAGHVRENGTMARMFGIAVLVALVTAIVGVIAWFEVDISGARQRFIGRSQTVETSFGTVEYALAGDGKPVLVVHGAGGGFDQGLAMTSAAAQHGSQLIVPSRFGYLRSALPDHASSVMQADAFAKLLDRLGVVKVGVIAISAGAWSALQFAARHPERCAALVLIVPAKALPPGTANNGGFAVRAMFGWNFLMWAASKAMHVAPSTLLPLMFGTPGKLWREASVDDRRRLVDLFDGLLPVTSRLGGMQLDIATAQHPEPLALERITCPVLAISSEDDLFRTADRVLEIASSVASGRAIVYPTGGHALVGRQADVAEDVAKFLSAASGVR
jgi:2-hydroxy-6-oxonona-2,4-dienedioate hydrolase